MNYQDGDIQYDLWTNHGDQSEERTKVVSNPLDIPTVMSNYCFHYLDTWNPVYADNLIDSDGDGLTDVFEEQVTGTDPMNPDSDGGGENDCLEYTYGRMPLNSLDDYVINYDLLIIEPIEYIISFHLIEIGDSIELETGTLPNVIQIPKLRLISLEEV